MYVPLPWLPKGIGGLDAGKEVAEQRSILVKTPLSVILLIQYISRYPNW